ncbi:MAG: efflux RND transporter permease subunit [Archangiaceae bacterium]|nr:efflux RND transporter permease subunit [Archangiaceae bacterium]
MSRNVVVAIAGAIVVLGCAAVAIVRSTPPPLQVVHVGLRAPSLQLWQMEEKAQRAEHWLSKLPNVERLSTRVTPGQASLLLKVRGEEAAVLAAVRGAIPVEETPASVWVDRSSQRTVLAVTSDRLPIVEVGRAAAALVAELERRDGVLHVEWCPPEEELRIALDAERTHARQIALSAVRTGVWSEQRSAPEFMRDAPVSPDVRLSDIATISIARAPSCAEALDGREAVLLWVSHLPSASLEMATSPAVTLATIPSVVPSRTILEPSDLQRASVGTALSLEGNVARSTAPIDAGVLVAHGEEHLTFFVRGENRSALRSHAEALHALVAQRARWSGALEGLDHFVELGLLADGLHGLDEALEYVNGRIEQRSADGQRRAITFDPDTMLEPGEAERLRGLLLQTPAYVLLREDGQPALAFSFSLDVRSAEAIARSIDPPPGVDVVLRTSSAADW